MPEDIVNPLDAMTGKQPEKAEINWESVSVDDIPFDVLKQHPAYKDLLSESIERRQTISTLRQQIEKPAEQPPVEPETEEVTNPLEAQIAAMQGMIEQLTSRLEQDAQTRLGKYRQQLITQHSIPEELHDLVVGQSEEEIEQRVKTLASYVVPQPHKGKTPAGNQDQNTNPDNEILAKVKARLTGADTGSVFSPGVHRQLGGGPL